VHYADGITPGRQTRFTPVTIPADHIWVMGDARDNSADSREQGHGPVPVSAVIGKARFIVLPFNRLGGIPDTNPHQGPVAAPAWTTSTPAPLGVLLAVPLVRGHGRWRSGRNADTAHPDTAPPHTAHPDHWLR